MVLENQVLQQKKVMSQDKPQKLELTWIEKDDKREPIEPRILIENPKYSGERRQPMNEEHTMKKK